MAFVVGIGIVGVGHDELALREVPGVGIRQSVIAVALAFLNMLSTVKDGQYLAFGQLGSILLLASPPLMNFWAAKPSGIVH